MLYLDPGLLGGFGVVEKLLAGGEITWLGMVAWESALRVDAPSPQ